MGCCALVTQWMWNSTQTNAFEFGGNYACSWFHSFEGIEYVDKSINQ